MGIRGYVIATLKEPTGEDELWELTKKLESTEDVEFAARVIGPYDFVLTVDTKQSLEAVTQRIETAGVFESMVSLKIDDIFGKHREIKDLRIFNDL